MKFVVTVYRLSDNKLLSCVLSLQAALLLVHTDLCGVKVENRKSFKKIKAICHSEHFIIAPGTLSLLERADRLRKSAASTTTN